MNVQSLVKMFYATTCVTTMAVASGGFEETYAESIEPTAPTFNNAFECYEYYGFPHEVLGMTQRVNGEVIYDMDSPGAKDYPCLEYKI